MDKFTKRDATDHETEHAIDSIAEGPLANPKEWYQQKQAEAVAEGYKSEVCECGAVFCAFHHYTNCRHPRCPMSDGVSLLERMASAFNEDASTGA